MDIIHIYRPDNRVEPVNPVTIGPEKSGRINLVAVFKGFLEKKITQ